MLAVTVGVKVKAAGRWWNSFMYPSDGGFFFFFSPIRVLEGQVGAVCEQSSCKDMKVLRIVRIV